MSEAAKRPVTRECLEMIRRPSGPLGVRAFASVHQGSSALGQKWAQIVADLPRIIAGLVRGFGYLHIAA
jgi:hypothetical protein